MVHKYTVLHVKESCYTDETYYTYRCNTTQTDVSHYTDVILHILVSSYTDVSRYTDGVIHTITIVVVVVDRFIVSHWLTYYHRLRTVNGQPITSIAFVLYACLSHYLIDF